MQLISDLQLLAAQGLPTPYIAGDPLFSPIAQRPLMTHRIFPGMSGFLPIGSEQVVVIFVDQLPADEELRGSLRLTTRQDAEGDCIEQWVIQAESTLNAWQFMTVDERVSIPANRIVLCQWRPGALQHAYNLHHQMIDALGLEGEAWLIGSELEKEAYSQFVLSTGRSSLAHPLEALGFITMALENVGSTIVMDNQPDLVTIPCLAIKAYPIRWYTES